MKVPWKRIVTGLKVALNIALKLNDVGVIRVKELDRVKTIKDVIEEETRRR
jgi:hypothetical protein